MEPSIQKKLDTFFAHYQLQKYKKGEILIRAGDKPKGIFYLQKGFVKVYGISEKGDEVVLNIFKPISYFSMSWAFNNTHIPYFYEAISEVEVWLAPRKDIVNFLKDNPQVLLDLVSRVYKGVDGVLTRMMYLMSGNAYTRFITEIIICAKRFGTHENNKIIVNISEKDIASQSGLTRETVSREMSKLKKSGLVLFDRKILEITDINMLISELTSGF